MSMYNMSNETICNTTLKMYENIFYEKHEY